jgi:hypothetical protein
MLEKEKIRLKPNQTNCPKCNSDWDGGSILESFIKQREEGVSYWQGKSDAEIEKIMEDSYSPPYRWLRKIGIHLPYDHPNYYDGVSYWKCPDCNTYFNRFTGFEETIN